MDAQSVREERLYFVTLKFVKGGTIDPFEMIENELKAVYETMIVGQRQYESWDIGEEVSSVYDWGDLIFNGNLFTHYTVSVSEKQSVSQYFWKDSTWSDREMTELEYTAVISELSKGNILTVPYSGQTTTYVLDKPLSEYQFVTSQPMTRYFVTVLVKNETITFDATKWIRNATNTHHIEVEVSKEVYEKSVVGEAWNPDWNVGSFILRGRFSQLHGYVENLWTEEDPSFQEVTTTDGRTMIIPTSK